MFFGCALRGLSTQCRLIAEAFTSQPASVARAFQPSEANIRMPKWTPPGGGVSSHGHEQNNRESTMFSVIQ